MSSNNKRKNSQRLQILLTEYETCKDKVNMYSSLMWQTGAIFFAGAFVLLGIIISVWQELPRLSRPTVVALFGIVSVGMLCFWRFILYNRYRFYNLLALLRTWAIEKYLVDNFDAKDELEWEGISTRTIENWITEMDNKKDDEAWKDFLEGLKNDIMNPPIKGRVCMKYVIFGFLMVWVALFALSILVPIPAN